MKKILVLDIDGTLTNSKKQITNATKEAIWNIMDKGHLIALASGRPTPGMRRYEKELELDKRGGYLLSYNGAKIVECTGNQVIHQNFLPLQVVPALYEFAVQRGAGLITYDGDVVISAFEPDEFIKLEAGINWLPVRHQPDFVEYVDYNVNKCLMTAPGEQAAVYEKELQALFGDIISIYRSEPFFIEIMPKDINKAVGLELVLKSLGMGAEQAVCCGDGYNDISMIEYAGMGVAMGNAQPAVKEAADYIAPGNDEDGLVEVIERFFLNENDC